MEAQFDPLFRFMEKYLALTDAEKSVVISSNSIRKFKKGGWIEPPGARTNAQDAQHYFVLEGCVCLYTSHSDKQIVSEFFFGGHPVVKPIQEAISGNHSLQCLEDSVVAVSSAERAEQLIRTMPRFESVCRKFAEESLDKNRRLHERLKLLSPLERYELAIQERPELASRVPQHALASYIGVTPETLSRLRSLRAKKRRVPTASARSSSILI
jgi:CRP-like cAMP-binding protein